ncbi:MAG: protein kinase [Elusimicrobiota bacterium]
MNSWKKRGSSSGNSGANSGGSKSNPFQQPVQKAQQVQQKAQQVQVQLRNQNAPAARKLGKEIRDTNQDFRQDLQKGRQQFQREKEKLVQEAKRGEAERGDWMKLLSKWGNKVKKRVKEYTEDIKEAVSGARQGKPGKGKKPGGGDVFDQRGGANTPPATAPAPSGGSSDRDGQDSTNLASAANPGDPGAAVEEGESGGAVLGEELPGVVVVETGNDGYGLSDEDKKRVEEAGFNLGNAEIENAAPVSGGADDAAEGQLASSRMLPEAALKAAQQAAHPPTKPSLVPGVQSYTDAEAKKTAESDALTAQAESKIRMSDYKAAIAAADKAIAADPNNANAYVAKAEALGHLGRHAEAELAAYRATQLDPTNARAFKNLGWAQLNQDKLRDALSSLNQAVRLDPRDAKAYIARAIVHERMGNADGVLADVRQAAELDAAYQAHLDRVLNGGKLFDPNVKDSYKLLDPFAQGAGAPAAPLRDRMLLVLGAAAFVIAVLLLRRKLSRGKQNARAELAGKLKTGVRPDASGLIGGKYQLTRIIGKGGMGQIWEARDHSLDRLVAIKKMALQGPMATEEGRQMYLKEARTLAQVHHPNIVDIFEIIDQGSGLHLVFELLKGKTLEQLVLEKKRIPIREAKKVLRSVCAALELAHKHGIIHRDLKPSNIMVTEQGYVKVMDFGIARQAGEDAAAPPAGNGYPTLGGPRTLPLSQPSTHHTQTVAGTPMYMAPEAYKGVYSPHVDIYALGIIFYEMVTGALPFRANTGTDRIFMPASRRMPGIPGEFDALIQSCVAPDPQARPGAVTEFLRRMEAVPEPVNHI